MERHLATVIMDLYEQHTPLSLAVIQEKTTSLHEAVKELFRKEKAAKV
jgi:hypothetical protein